MKKTYYKVTTKEGFDRKLAKLISVELKRKHPKIFKELYESAIDCIITDNESVFSKVMDVQKTKRMAGIKRKRKEDIDNYVMQRAAERASKKIQTKLLTGE